MTSLASKGSSLQETHMLREKQNEALVREAAKFYSEADPNKPVWNYKDQLIEYCWQDVIVLLLG
jgi:hypothetical protein